ncbi:MAG: hypothetical protein H6Q73_1321 [Firmicutes bacterium]|nr:hypothetical protein [Bacillota bacterium]
MKDALFIIAEQKILEAIENGELNNLPGSGKPLNLDAEKNVPPDLRLEYKILKNAGMLPEEASLKKEIAILQEMLRHCQNHAVETSLKQKLTQKILQYDLLKEKRKRR